MTSTWVIVLIIFIAVDVVLTSWILWRRFRSKKFGTRELEYIKAHWIRIIDSFKSHPKQGILDADKLLDYALDRKGFVGTLGEKLKKAGPRFSNLNDVWNAHKLRNKVAHEFGEIGIDDAKRALMQFKRALNDLGANL